MVLLLKDPIIHPSRITQLRLWHVVNVFDLVFAFLDCGRAVTVQNGRIDFTNELTTYGQSVPITCDRGYNFTGETHIECLANGSWSKASGCKIIGIFALS